MVVLPRCIHQSIEYPLAALSLFSNALLLVLVLHPTSRMLGNYRVLLCIFAVFDVVISLLHAAILPAFVQTSFGFAIFALDAVDMPERIGYFLNTLYCVLYYEPFILLTFHFIYRLLYVLKQDVVKKHFGTGLAVMFLINSVIVLIVIADIWFVHYRDDENFFADVMMRDYGVDLFRVPKPTILPVHYIRSPQYGSGLNWYSILTVLNVSMIAATSLVFSAVCGVWTIRAVHTQIMSEASRRIQVQLLRALIVQFANPVVLTIVPFFCIVALPATGLDFGQTANHMAFFTSAFPVLDPICMIIAYPKFRAIVLGYIPGKRKGTSVSNEHVTAFTKTTVVR